MIGKKTGNSQPPHTSTRYPLSSDGLDLQLPFAEFEHRQNWHAEHCIPRIDIMFQARTNSRIYACPLTKKGQCLVNF
jgi:hypothetical protein